MRHQKAGTKLNRTGSHRNAMFRNMVTSLFQHGQIRTTDAKAKELKRWADQMVTLAKRGDLHARRQALSIMRDKKAVHKLFEEASARYGDRAGGYTNVVRIGSRRGDAAPMSLVELVKPPEKQEKKKKKGAKAKKKAAEKTKKVAPVIVPGKEQPEEVKAEDQKAGEAVEDQEAVAGQGADQAELEQETAPVALDQEADEPVAETEPEDQEEQEET
jgi:large subunit ribosomal protein L17